MEKQLADEFLKALVSSYVWVASVDAGVDAAELHKYENTMVQSQFATQFDVSHMRRYFKDMVTLFESDYEAAVQLTKDRLQELSKKEYLTEEVIRVCRAAVVGDGKIEDAEELVLQEIATILGIKSEASL